MGFNEAFFFDFVDVGANKERAIAKLKGMYAAILFYLPIGVLHRTRLLSDHLRTVWPLYHGHAVTTYSLFTPISSWHQVDGLADECVQIHV
jgi:hypothetical protein